MSAAIRASDPHEHYRSYTARLSNALNGLDWSVVELLCDELFDCWTTGRQVFLAGNGGSGGNAVHLANDLLYALSKTPGSGLRVHALPANPAVLTCLANDEGYASVFSLQLAVLARPEDILIVFSGSGESPNILQALEVAREIGMTSYAVVAFSGGKAKALADRPIHVQIDDMQVAEDVQLVIGHMLMQRLSARRLEVKSRLHR